MTSFRLEEWYEQNKYWINKAMQNNARMMILVTDKVGLMNNAKNASS